MNVDLDLICRICGALTDFRQNEYFCATCQRPTRLCFCVASSVNPNDITPPEIIPILPFLPNWISK